MPAEVFDLWIRPNIPAYDWPFSSVAQSVEGTRWDLFFSERPLKWWAGASWQRKSFRFDSISLCAVSLQRATWILDSERGIRFTPTSTLHDTKKRFWDCVSYIDQHGAFPSPLIGISLPADIEIVDGHHRIASFLYHGASPDFLFDIWLASNEAA